ncbi:uncharacterized protein [Triticum aestivum]|uniref:uncharacterized protein isoform X2 n=1 Tax=Triticum aestivum TaxID=4565 RepID=UPI001D032291|nr:uncharacterized protein LOC123080503 isoform X2 [Triticum aestivum]
MQTTQLEALRAAQQVDDYSSKAPRYEQHINMSGEMQAPEWQTENSVVRTTAKQADAKGKGIAEESSDPSNSDSDDEPMDPSVGLGLNLTRTDRRGGPNLAQNAPTGIMIGDDLGRARVTGPRSMNRLRQRLQPRISNGGETVSNMARFSAQTSCRVAMLRSRGDYLRAELQELEAKAKADLEYGAIHGILPSRRGSSSAAVDMNAEGESEPERRERVRSLSAAALAVVEQAIGNPELFEGIFEQARLMLSDLGVEGYNEDHGTGVDANGNNTPQRDDDDRINWEELEHSSQEHRQHISSQAVGALIVTDSNLRAIVKASEQAATSRSLFYEKFNNIDGRNLLPLFDEDDADDESSDVPPGVPTEYIIDEDESTDLDEEFLAVASQVPIHYMEEDEKMEDGSNLMGLNNLTDLLASLNTCIRWIAWIGAVLVVGSGREGDELDEDPPLNGLILLGGHGVNDNSDGERDGNENRSLEQRRARARAFDIAATCHPGLSFHRENGEADCPL